MVNPYQVGAGDFLTTLVRIVEKTPSGFWVSIFNGPPEFKTFRQVRRFCSKYQPTSIGGLGTFELRSVDPQKKEG